ncbi:MAG: tRNA (adenine-N1)-methyltransferase [Chloroflexi bacterium]|nr:tRNA (adenine-N1)-methyltransferase [Chloroflexota bacterium]
MAEDVTRPDQPARAGERILLIDERGKRYYERLRVGGQFSSNRGVIVHDDLIGRHTGRQVFTHRHEGFLLLRPTFYDELLTLERESAIIYPKDIGLILLKLDIAHGDHVIEAGSGSGALTCALARAVAPTGCVHSFDMRSDMLAVARRNLERLALTDHAQLEQRDITAGFGLDGVGALFLDVREPWRYMYQVREALVYGGRFGALLPTTNQVSQLLAALPEAELGCAEVIETMLRELKPLPGRLRPEDTMVGHTGYLIFARKIDYGCSPQGEAAPSSP